MGRSQGGTILCPEYAATDDLAETQIERRRVAHLDGQIGDILPFLDGEGLCPTAREDETGAARRRIRILRLRVRHREVALVEEPVGRSRSAALQIGRASCRARVD